MNILHRIAAAFGIMSSRIVSDSIARHHYEASKHILAAHSSMQAAIDAAEAHNERTGLRIEAHSQAIADAHAANRAIQAQVDASVDHAYAVAKLAGYPDAA